MTMRERIAKLIDVVLEAWSRCLPPPYGDGEFSSSKDGQTDCNRFVNQVCSGFGYKKFAGMPANGIAASLRGSPDWLQVAGAVAQHHANGGALILGAWENKTGPHGHVDVVIPGPLAGSAKWNDQAVPRVANVGSPEFCKIGVSANFVFGEEPLYYVLTSTIDDKEA